MKIFLQAFIVVIALFRYYLVAPKITFTNALTTTTTASSFLSSLSDASIGRRHVLELLSKGTIVSQSTIMIPSTTLSSDDSQDADASPATTTTTATSASATPEEDEIVAAEAAATRKQRMIERRQLMDASRSSNNRQSYLDLSKQRAFLYNTTPKAITCPTKIPCL